MDSSSERVLFPALSDGSPSTNDTNIIVRGGDKPQGLIPTIRDLLELDGSGPSRSRVRIGWLTLSIREHPNMWCRNVLRHSTPPNPRRGPDHG